MSGHGREADFPAACVAAFRGASRLELSEKLRVEAARIEKYRAEYVVVGISVARQFRAATPENDGDDMAFLIQSMGYLQDLNAQVEARSPSVAKTSPVDEQVGECQFVDWAFEAEDEDVLRRLADLLEAIPSNARILDISVASTLDDSTQNWRAAVYFQL